MQEGLNIFESGNLENEKMQSGLSNDLQLKASRDVSWQSIYWGLCALLKILFISQFWSSNMRV